MGNEKSIELKHLIQLYLSSGVELQDLVELSQMLDKEILIYRERQLLEAIVQSVQANIDTNTHQQC